MLENFFYRRGFHDRRQKLHLPAAVPTALHVDPKHALEQFCPAHSRFLGHPGLVFLLWLPLGNYLAADFGMQRQHSVKSRQVGSWWRNEGG